MDRIISELLSFWQPSDAERIPRSIIIWLHHRDWKYKYIEQELEVHLWRCYSNTLLPELREESLTVLWRLASLPKYRYDPELSSTSNSHFTFVELVLTSEDRMPR
jgi:hypothetical protein